ncbi:hypothetical protein UPYG_G00209770 [Umbra pygmaea]|uniref:Uncharacterized protein n=1 Tax=Umbra pygmaea TaxID=75934 RepID=A0ABD0WPB2_UMBPY
MTTPHNMPAQPSATNATLPYMNPQPNGTPHNMPAQPSATNATLPYMIPQPNGTPHNMPAQPSAMNATLPYMIPQPNGTTHNMPAQPSAMTATPPYMIPQPNGTPHNIPAQPSAMNATLPYMIPQPNDTPHNMPAQPSATPHTSCQFPVPQTHSFFRRNVGSTMTRLFEPYKRLRGKRNHLPSPWEHDFFCLSSPDTVSLPTAEESILLAANGLGKKRIKFTDNNGSHEDFVNKLQEVFSQLKNAGGFKLMRCCRSRQFIEIPMPPQGYTISFLRIESGLNKAVAYIIPLQYQLDIRSTCLTEGQQNVILEKCRNCSGEVPLHLIAEHLIACEERISERIPQASMVTIKLRVSLLLDHNMTVFNCRRALPHQSLEVPITLTAERFYMVLKREFPSLRDQPFEMCRVDRHRNVHVVSSLTPLTLRNSRELGRSALYLRPKEALDAETSASSDESDTEMQDDRNIENEEIVVDLEHHTNEHGNIDLENQVVTTVVCLKTQMLRTSKRCYQNSKGNNWM